MKLNRDFQIESKLRKLRSDLSDNYKNNLIVMSKALDKIDSYFPNFTNHSLRHCLLVMEFCNKLIDDNIDLINEDEIYILMMAVLFHDFGMTLSPKTFQRFKNQVIDEKFILEHPELSEKDLIRMHHHLFSDVLVRSFANIFEIPSEEYVDCIAKVSKGHRKVDLLDKDEYDPEYKLNNGNKVCLPYLSALIRLADELDIAKDRNPIELYKQHMDSVHWRKHLSIEHLSILNDHFKLDVSLKDEEALSVIEEDLGKLKNTFEYCKNVINNHTPFHLHQSELIINYLK